MPFKKHALEGIIGKRREAEIVVTHDGSHDKKPLKVYGNSSQSL
jgi:hypothetical protein